MRDVKVLVVTADARLAARCVDALAPKFDPILTEDGEAALLRAAKVRPDGLLIDLDVPHSDMFNVVTALKGYEPTRHVSIIAIASACDADLVELAREHGCDRVIGPAQADGVAEEMDRLVRTRMAKAA